MSKGDRRAWHVLIIVFAGLVFLFGPETQTLVIGTQSQCERWIMGCFRVAQLLLCVMPTYFLATGLISVFRGKAADSFRRALPDAEAHTGMAPKVAVLYTTRNDFHEAAVDRLLGIGYGNCGVFLCDDSTVPHWLQQVDEWAQTERDVEKWKIARTGDNDTESAEPSNTQKSVMVMRRDGRRGFKAGNLNAVLNEIQHRFDYFVVCDADGELPEDFIERCLERLGQEEAERCSSGGGSVDPAIDRDRGSDLESGTAGPRRTGSRIAFVQARQEAAEGAPGTLARALGSAVGAHFRWLVRAREREGFLMFYGHGALISMAAWRAAGGFPEIATEDLAFSLELRRRGWRGMYADDIVCRESVPPTADRLGRRSEKWIRGTMECLRRHGPAFLRAKSVAWWEKADVLVNGLFHLMPVPALIFFLLLCGPYPMAMASLDRTHSGVPPAAPPNLEAWWHRALSHLHSGPGGADWTVLAVILWLGGTVVVWSALTTGGLKSRLAGLFTYALVVTLWLGSLVRDTVAAVAYVVTGRAHFPVTADSMRSSRSLAESWWVKTLTVVFASATAWGAWRWANLWLLAPAVASPWVALRGTAEKLTLLDRLWVSLPAALGMGCLVLRVVG